MDDPDRTRGSDRTSRAPDDDGATLSPDEQVATFHPGTILAGRYHIIDVLGIGGMGTVYKVFDTQLTRVVALKTILPEMAATPSALRRFKQELLAAQSIIHKNVVRIFDIGEDAATKFITMDFIEGADLKHLISERGRLPATEAAGIIRQVCQGLEAAHAAGVVHRDLKPQNIMIEKDGRIVVMDFGIAHSGQTRGATQTGALLGTPDYMSPEQAQAEAVDARSDIYAVGLILYELLTGKLPFQGKTALQTMFKRTTEQPVPPAEIEPDIPKEANDIVMKCLQTEREKRYQSVTGILADLEQFDSTPKAAVANRAKAPSKKASRYRSIGIAAALVLIAVVSGFLFRNGIAPPPAVPVERPPTTVIIADFANNTGDTVFDGVLAPVVKMALEGAGFITVYDRTQLRSLGLQPVSGRLDDEAARQIAVSQGLSVVIGGSLDRRGDSYALSMKATQAVTGNVIHTAEETAASKDQVLLATMNIAAGVRTALGDDTSDASWRFAMETLTASLEAVHEYAIAMDQLANGKYEEALQSFSKAVNLDPKFGLAYAGMAIASRNLGRQQDAENYIQLALERIDLMTERERLRTRGSYYALRGDHQKCVEEYGALIDRFPSDAAAHNNLAYCWTQLRNMPKALEHVRQAAAILPRRLIYKWNTSMYASYGSDFETGEREARSLEELDSSSPLGFSARAFAQLGQGQLAQAAETYQKLSGLGTVSASDAQSGLADLALYEGRFGDAIRILEQSAAGDLSNKFADRAAAKFIALAYARLSQDQKAMAITAARNALSASTVVKIKSLAGLIFAAAGDTARAQALAGELALELQNEPQAYAKLIEGEIALEKNDPRMAIRVLTEAKNLVDTWIGRFSLGRAYLAAGAFAEADSEFDLCIKRRGEALALFLDESPTFGRFPPVYYYQGRVREGLNAGFAESYKTYLSIREKAGEDPLSADARNRAGR